MKLTIPLGCLVAVILSATTVYAGSHQNRSGGDGVRAARSSPAVASNASSYVRSQPVAARNWNSQNFSSQRFARQRLVTPRSQFATGSGLNNRARLIAREQLVNRDRVGSGNWNGQRWNRGSGGNNQFRNAQRLNRRGGDGQFRDASFASRRNGNGWRRHHHHHDCDDDRFFFYGSFGYPFYPFGYSYYNYYPYYGYSSYYPTSYDVSYDNNDYQSDYNDGSYGDGGGSIVLEVQRRLAREGFYQGPLDGVMGSRTHYAIRAYERSHGLRADGEIDDQLLGTMGLR
jgi:hypothetical protein